MELKIESARITKYPKNFYEPMPQIWVKYEGEVDEAFLFEFYPDEISFTTEEIIGLTRVEAFRLKFEKDKEYFKK